MSQKFGVITLLICYYICTIFASCFASAFFNENILVSNYKGLDGDYKHKKQYLPKNFFEKTKSNEFVSNALKKKNLKTNKIKSLSQLSVLLPEEENYVDDYETILSALQSEVQFIHSKKVDVSKLSPCKEVEDRNATLVKSIGKSVRSIINLRPKSQYEIAYCAGSESIEIVGGNFLVPELLRRQSTPRVTNSCAVDAKCATIYRWKLAEVELKVEEDNTHIYFSDKVLVPSGCTCVINALQSGFSDTPIIIF